MGAAVGIDLGTTNTVAAAVSDGVASPLPDGEGRRLLPSVVSFHPSGSVLVGRGALERRLIDGPNTIYSVKRLIGRAWASPEVEQARGKLPFELREGPKGGVVVAARGETYSLPEISAFVLRQAKALAEAALGQPVDRAVITVPANFNDLQRAATKTAGRLAGLEVLRILNEPTAAALAYGPQGKEQERIAVYDLGGGTFDITVLDLSGSVFEVLATAGDTALGGDDVDLLVAERMADDLLKNHRFDARAQPLVFGRLRMLAEDMKRELSTRDEHVVIADDLVPAERGKTVEWRFRMTRPELEWASLALVERTFRVAQQALDAAGVQPKDVDRILLVGGATRMPMVARKVEQFFGRPPMVRINPDEVVALGASIQAALLDRARQRGAAPMEHPRIAETSVVQPLPEDPMSLGEPPIELPIVGVGARPSPGPGPGPAAAPAAAARPAADFLPGGGAKPLVFELGPAPQRVPGAPPPPPRPRLPTMPFPYEAASDPPPPPAPAPAAPRAPSLPPQAAPPPRPAAAAPSASPVPDRAPVAPEPIRPAPRPAPLLIDVTPLSLSVETVGGFGDVLIEANTPVPCDRTRTFATASDDQTSVQVRVAQGELKRFAENTLLGELELTGLTPAPRGQTRVAVTFEIDADGILNVRARDVKTGHETAARMQLVGAPTDAGDLDAMRARQAAHPLALPEAPR